MRRANSRLGLVVVLCIAAACDGGREEVDGGPGPMDAGERADVPPRPDAFVPIPDGGPPDGGPMCGNRMLEASEECDDGNLFPGDGCSPLCTREPVCGNGELEEGEGCDDGAREPGDGCSATCAIEEQCGDGELDPGEDCDDGNREPLDGCDAACMREPRCGDEILDSGEECDDGNEMAMDGCDACVIELAACGDGTLAPWVEECDDANIDDGDGCSGACTIEGTCEAPIDLATAGIPTPTGFRVVGQNTAHVLDNGSGTCRSTLGGLDRVYLYTPPRNGRLTARTNGLATTYDTVLHARTDCDLLPTQIACDDDAGGGGRSLFSIDVVGGVPIYIFADARVTVSGTLGTSATGTFELEVSLVATAGEDEPCDPAGVTALCTAGLLCAGDGAGGYTCQSDADLGCGAGVAVVDMTARLTRGQAVYDGDTRMRTNLVRGTCTSSSHTAGEVIHSLVLPYEARVAIDVANAFDAAIYVRSSCLDDTTQLACTDEPESFPGSTLGLLPAGTQLFIVVDGWGSGGGTYTLTTRLQRTLPEGSPCDPANPNDACAESTLCASDGAGGHTCQSGVDLGCGVGVPVIDLTPLISPTGSITYSGDTTSSIHRTRGSCAPSTSVVPEVAHRIVLPYDAEVRISGDPSWDEVLYVRNVCTMTAERFCSDSPTVPYTRMGLLTAGTELYLFMDGWSSSAVGSYPLFVQLRRRSGAGDPCGLGADDPVCTAGLVCRLESGGRVCRPSFCGDGVIEGSEVCDDGNMESLDGCSSTCAIEAAGPGGETCADAVRINLVPTSPTTRAGNAAGSTTDATADLAGYCSSTSGAPDHVYVFGVAERSNVSVRLVPGASFDGALYVRGGLGRACDDPTGEYYCRDAAGAGSAEPIVLEGVPAGTYYVVVDGVGTGTGNRGSYTVEVRTTAAPEM
jgi:cysteine-rich repeat protein